MASARDMIQGGWGSKTHFSRWDADISIPEQAQAQGIAADPDDDQGAMNVTERNRHMQQWKNDNDQYKRDKLELASALSKKKPVAPARAASAPEVKPSKRAFTVRIKNGKGEDANALPEAKKVKPDDEKVKPDDENAAPDEKVTADERERTEAAFNGPDASAVSKTAGISGLGGYSSDSSEEEGSAESSSE